MASSSLLWVKGVREKVFLQLKPSQELHFRREKQKLRWAARNSCSGIFDGQMFVAFSICFWRVSTSRPSCIFPVGEGWKRLVLPCWVGFGWILLSQASSRLYDPVEHGQSRHYPCRLGFCGFQKWRTTLHELKQCCGVKLSFSLKTTLFWVKV